MTTISAERDLQVFTRLGCLYPGMRFGQLFEFIATLTGEDAPGEVGTASDESIIAAAETHLARRVDIEPRAKGDDAFEPMLRSELLSVLEILWRTSPTMRLGQLVSHLAVMAGVGLYDIEDDQLLVVSKRYRQQRAITATNGAA